MLHRIPLRTFASLATLAFASALPAPAQTLARPHWAGSGVTAEPWWLRGVFYRINPDRFQDSTGIGRGDLPGIAQRLSYIQSLGVDAIILDPGMDGDDTASVAADNFGSLAREAANDRLRLLVSLPLADRNHHLLPDQVVLANARRWLTQGAAGLFFDVAATRALATDQVRGVGLLRQLRALCSGVPGDRLMLAISSGFEDPALDRALDLFMQLRAGAALGQQPASAALLRIRMEGLLHEDRPSASHPRATTAAPLLHAARPGTQPRDTPGEDGLNRTLATALLASRAAVLLDFGQEVGARSTRTGSPLMPWTPTDLTLPAPVKTAPEPKKPVEEFGVYHPYIPPPPKSVLAAPVAPEVALTDAAPSVPPELMPGFTTVERRADVAPLLAANSAAANVLTQDADPSSLLNLYRHLIHLHHGDPTLHSGSTTFLEYDKLNALVWVRRAPPSVRTSYDIVVICNLSPQESALFLEGDLAQLHMRTGALRSLLAGGPATPVMGSTSFVRLPPYTVFLGELYR